MSKLLHIFAEARRARSAHVAAQKPMFPKLHSFTIFAFILIGFPILLLLSYSGLVLIRDALQNGVTTFGRRGGIEIFRSVSPFSFYAALGLQGLLSLFFALGPVLFVYDALKKPQV